MSFEFTCHCGKEIRLKDTAAGKKYRCSECGEVHRLSLSAVSSAAPKDHQSKKDLKAHRTRIDVGSRLFGILLAIVSGYVAIQAFGPTSSLKRGAQNIDYPMMLWFVFLGIPGIFIAIQGVNFGENARKNRRTGLFYIGGGLLLMLFAVIVSVLGSVVVSAVFGPSSVLAVGAFFTGAAGIVVGLMAVITGHGLGDTTKSSKKKRRRVKPRN